MEENIDFGVVEEPTADVAEPQDAVDPAEPSTPESETQEVVPEQPEIPNEVWATARRRAEQEAAQRYASDLERYERERAEYDRASKESERLLSVLRTQGFTGGASEIADNIAAAQRGITPEQARYERIMQEQQLEADRRRYKATDPEYQQLRQTQSQLSQMAAETIRRDDLAAIKAHNPKETIKGVGELGEMFGALRLQGVSAVDAYEAVRAVNSRKQPPKSMGGLQSQGEQQLENKYATMSDEDFEREIARAERGELKKG